MKTTLLLLVAVIVLAGCGPPKNPELQQLDELYAKYDAIEETLIKTAKSDLSDAEKKSKKEFLYIQVEELINEAIGIAVLVDCGDLQEDHTVTEHLTQNNICTKEQ